jgi:hypothetical protein
LPLAGQLLDLVKRASAGNLQASSRPQFQRLGLEFVERQSDHIAREEMALLPALDDALDEADDARLAAAYAGA